jgi:uncharacterized membrane protein
VSTAAAIAKHPIHPMLVVFPIGLWIFSLISDLVLVTGLRTTLWNDLAFYTMAGGLVGALLAAIPGFFDLLWTSDSKVWKIGVYHLILNFMVIAIFTVNLYLRATSLPRDPLSIGLSILGIILLAVSGWIGGEMVNVCGTGIQPPPRRRSTENQQPPRDRLR